MRILINNCQKLARLPTKELRGTADIVLRNVVPKDVVVGVTFVDDKTIRDLNKRYRKKDRPTDVLSFESDVVISVETAIRQAKYYKHNLLKELKILLVHGMLHIFGYDHVKKKDFEIMRKKEKEIYEAVS